MLNKYKYDTKRTWQVMKEITGVSEYLPQCNASMEHKELSFREIEKAFKVLKRNKAIGCDGLNGNIIIDVYDSLKVILFEIFKASLEEAVFPEKLKIEKVIPVSKKVIKKMLKTTNQFLFFQFFPKCLNVLCIIICMNIS